MRHGGSATSAQRVVARVLGLLVRVPELLSGRVPPPPECGHAADRRGSHARPPRLGWDLRRRYRCTFRAGSMLPRRSLSGARGHHEEVVRFAPRGCMRMARHVDDEHRRWGAITRPCGGPNPGARSGPTAPRPTPPSGSPSTCDPMPAPRHPTRAASSRRRPTPLAFGFLHEPPVQRRLETPRQ